MTARPQHHRSRTIAILMLIPLLAGCGGLLSSPPKRQLYRVNPTLAFAAGLPHVAAQLLVASPTAPAGLDTERIALSRAPLSLDYFADAQWADRMPFLIQTALVQGFETSAAIPAVAPDNGSLSADFELETAIRDFEAIYDASGEPPRVAVALDVKLVRMPERRIVAQIAVSREAKAADNAVPEIVAAFDSALGGAVTEIVTWTLGNRALSERRGSLLSPTRIVENIGGATR
jgi:cholesterol transport system auxiliary component